MDLGFDVKDFHGKSFNHCCVSKLNYGPNPLDEPKPNPFVSVILNLKPGDKVRFFGDCSDFVRVEEDGTTRFFIDRIEMIESAAEKKAKEQLDAAAP